MASLQHMIPLLLVATLAIQAEGASRVTRHELVRREIPEDCLRCICIVESNCQMPDNPENPADKRHCVMDGGSYSCGPYQIKEAYWIDCSQGGNVMNSWLDCTKSFECSEQCVCNYMERYATKDRLGHEPTCEDFARIHNGGPNGHNKDSTDAYWERVKALKEEKTTTPMTTTTETTDGPTESSMTTEAETTEGVEDCEDSGGECISPDLCSGITQPKFCPDDFICCSRAVVRRDPHLTSFDGRHFNFQGICWYTIATVCSKQLQDIPFFEIIGLFEPRDLPDPEIKTRTVTVVITVDGESVTLNRDNTVMVNNLPGLTEPRMMDLTRTNDTVIVRPYGVGLTVRWQGRTHTVSIALDDTRYHGKVCGLLGNNDGDPKNDFIKRDGSATDDKDAFGESWRVPGMSCPGN